MSYNDAKIQLYNAMTNTMNQSTTILESHSTAISNDSISKFNIYTQNKIAEAEERCRNIQLTYAANPEMAKAQINNTVNNCVTDITLQGNTTTNYYGNTINNIVNTQQNNATVSAQLQANKIATNNGVSGSSLENLKSWALTQLQTIWKTFSGFGDSIVKSFKEMINSIVDTICTRIRAIGEGFLNVLNSTITAISNLATNTLTLANNTVNSIKNTGHDFYARLHGQSSTSLYAQQSVPDGKGNMVTNPSASASTPTAKIVEPNMKTDTNTVTKYIANPLAGLLGFVSKLIPVPISTPTGEKKVS